MDDLAPQTTRMHPVLFMAMDESESATTDILALTALLCPISTSRTLRGATYAFLDELQGLPERHISMDPPELHGSAMLKEPRWATDDKRLKCFEHVVDLVNRHALPVLRAGYYRRTVKSLLAHDPKLHGLCFSGLTFMVQPYLAANFVLPIMDRVHGRHEDVMAQMRRSLRRPLGSPKRALRYLIRRTWGTCTSLRAGTPC